MNNIIFDGNYLFYKTLYAFNTSTKKGDKVLDSKQEQESLVRKIAIDMSHAIRQFGSPDRIIFTVDSKSWRKAAYPDYKSTRIKNDKINWDNFYNMMNEFVSIIEKQGIIISRINGAEGDDLMYLWSKYLLKKGENSIIVTGDKDAYQLIRFNNNNFVTIYNPNSKLRKIYGGLGLNKWLKNDDVDIFDTNTYMNKSKSLLLNAINNIELCEINPIENVFLKVLTGDMGDNVPSIYCWKTETKSGTTRYNRISDGRALKILNFIKENHPDIKLFDLPKISKDITEVIKSITKQNPTFDEIEHNIKRNIRLIVLSESTIPEYLIDKFKEEYDNKINNVTLPAQKYDIELLLEASRFLKESQSIQSDIFSMSNKLF